jgi:hypothetical protein
MQLGSRLLFLSRLTTGPSWTYKTCGQDATVRLNSAADRSKARLARDVTQWDDTVPLTICIVAERHDGAHHTSHKSSFAYY